MKFKNKIIMSIAIMLLMGFTVNCDDVLNDEGDNNGDDTNLRCTAEKKEAVKAYLATFNSTLQGSCSTVKTKYAALSTELCADGKDQDEDGICDANEVILGTDPAIPDIFLEIDYMPAPADDPSMVLNEVALQNVRKVMNNNCYAIHMDVGSKFTDTDTFNAERFNYCGGNEVPLTTNIALGNGDPCTGSSCSTLEDIKAANFQSSRAKVFHYTVISKLSTQGAAGLGELIGKNFYVALGESSLESYYTDYWRDGQMAITIMHELGHNIGLSHNGDPDSNENYTPNYESIMNYAFGFGMKGLGDGTQWKYAQAQAGVSDCVVDDIDLGFEPLNEEIVLNYSNGLNLSINENKIDENKGYAPGGKTKVDYDCSGDYESSLSLNLNPNADVNVGKSILDDYNDWDNLILDKEKYWSSPQAYSPKFVAKSTAELTPSQTPTAIVCYSRKYIADYIAENGVRPPEKRIPLTLKK